MGTKAAKGSGSPKIRIAAVGDDRRIVRARLDLLEPAAKVIKGKKASGEDLVAMSVATYEALCRAAEAGGAQVAEGASRPARSTARRSANGGRAHGARGNGARGNGARGNGAQADDGPSQASVRVWREHRGLTQDELARRVGLSKSFLSEIENGKKTGSVRTLRALADALGIELTRLAV